MKKSVYIALIIVCIFTIFLLFKSTNQEDKIVIYTCMEEEANQALREKIKEKFPNLNIVTQYMSTGNISAKLKTEGTDIEADIIIDLETAQAENLKDNFYDLSEFDSSIYLDEMVKSKKYLPWSKETISVIVNKDYLQEHNLEVPKTYQDLLKPEYKNLIAMPDPKTSGTGYAYLLNAVNVMGEENAIEYFKELKQNLREFTASGSGSTNLLKQGEIAIALGMIYQGALAINDGYNFEIYSLDTGVPYNTTSFGIINGRENDANVKEVFEWLLTDFNKYHKENFIPDKILKDQNNYIKNYPTDFKDADMTGIDDIEIKNRLIEKWSEVNG